ncbi:hypothetical protein GCM10008932_00430 [Alkalibacterium iburiense]|uniref:Xylose isomerase-like TIM barrel domain-containing protein n=1 Tax=Alkalibacterium iburiense TaxID=290589 RepID=A0ABN0X074_9LACT
MTHHSIGISGSTILSDPKKFTYLFNKKYVKHIEIGEFSNQDAFKTFLNEHNRHGLTFGLHSPLYRNQSKYDLLEKVHYDSEESWIQFEKEVKHMSELGAEYILVHFPYFKEESERDSNTLIDNGLKKLQVLQEKYNIPIVCEPKLGLNRSSVGIDALHDFPVETWDKYNIKLCIDIGDYLMSAGSQTIEYIKKWEKYILVVHLHNVEYIGDDYFWIPVHPSQEENPNYYTIQDLIIQLMTQVSHP